jgi:hypothetical protein
MIDFILENPWVTLGFGLALAIGFVIAGLQTGRKELLWGAVAVGLLGCGLSYLGRVVVTERESVIASLTETANALERNDHPAIYEAIYPNPTSIVMSSKQSLPSLEVETFQITKIFEIQFSGAQNARRAKVAVNVVLKGNYRDFQLNVPRYLEIVLYRVNGKWLVYDYTEADPMQGFKQRLIIDGSW